MVLTENLVYLRLAGRRLVLHRGSNAGDVHLLLPQERWTWVNPLYVLRNIRIGDCRPMTEPLLPGTVGVFDEKRSEHRVLLDAVIMQLQRQHQLQV